MMNLCPETPNRTASLRFKKLPMLLLIIALSGPDFRVTYRVHALLFKK